MNKDIFQAANRRYTWQHVLTAADFRGDTALLRRDLAAALATRAYADEQGFEADQADVGRAVDEFRQQHDLISGEETEQWLDHCGLALEDVEGFFARQLLMNRFGDQADAIVRDYAPAEADVTDHMWPAAILTGDFGPLAVALVRHVAVRVDRGDGCTPPDMAEAMRAAEDRLTRSSVDAEWFTELVEMDAAYAAVERETVTAEALEHEIRIRPHQLTWVETAEITFTSLDEAREAHDCVANDGEGLEAVAARSGRAVDVAVRFYDDVADDERSLLFSAPLHRAFLHDVSEGIVAVREIRRKIAPDCNDPDVLARARARVFRTHVDAIVSQHVRWLFDPWVRT
jgi:hypothetical protein